MRRLRPSVRCHYAGHSPRCTARDGRSMRRFPSRRGTSRLMIPNAMPSRRASWHQPNTSQITCTRRLPWSSRVFALPMGAAKVNPSSSRHRCGRRLGKRGGALWARPVPGAWGPPGPLSTYCSRKRPHRSQVSRTQRSIRRVSSPWRTPEALSSAQRNVLHLTSSSTGRHGSARDACAYKVRAVEATLRREAGVVPGRSKHQTVCKPRL